MNYLKLYIKICKSRRFYQKSAEQYREAHHIFPTSIFGENNLIVNLTPKEHFIAHWLLYKICSKRYGSTHLNTIKMARAIVMMTNENSFVVRKTPSRYYDLSRKIWKQHYINPMSDPKNRMYGSKNPMYKIGSNHPLFGTKMSEITKKKIGDANKGKLSGDNNPAKREEVRLKISKNRKGKGAYTRETHPRTKISPENVLLIKSMWEKEKLKGISSYRFCRKYNQQFGVSPSGISNILFKY